MRIKTWIARVVSPRGVLWTALVLAVLFFIVGRLGWREYAGFLSGTGVPGVDRNLGIVLGIVYVGAYLGFVLAVPMLVIGAGVFWAFLKGRPRKTENRV